MMQNYLHLKFPALMTEALIVHKKIDCKINEQCVGALIRPDGLIKMEKLIGTGEKPIRFQTAFNLNRSYYIRFMETIETLTKRCS